MMVLNSPTTFNSALEAGIRAVAILAPSYPRAHDLHRLVTLDYLLVHSGDVGGPSSLHPRLPLRVAELLVRRKIAERGLLLMLSRGLVDRIIDASGFAYRAGEEAETFMSVLTSSYLSDLRDRGHWVARTFGELDDESLRQTMNDFFGQWIEEFQTSQRILEAEA